MQDLQVSKNYANYASPTLLMHFYICYYISFTCYYCNNEPIITVIMGSLLPIITRSIMGNNGFIITHYEPGQLADVELQRKDAYGAVCFP